MSDIRSNMSGTILEVKVEVGDQIQTGDEVAVLEAMKMEMAVEADQEGVVAEILVEEGDFVDEGEPILSLEE